MRGRTQWVRAAFDDCALDSDIVQLSWDEPTAVGQGSDNFVYVEAGLAFDRHCRLYHSVPAQGRIEILHWGEQKGLRIAPDETPRKLWAAPGAECGATDNRPMTGPQVPTAMVCDEADYLYIADLANKCLWLYDLWQGEFLRKVDLPGHPRDVVRNDEWIYVLLNAPAGWVRLSLCHAPQSLPWPAALNKPERLAFDADGNAYVLTDVSSPTAAIWRLGQPGVATTAVKVRDVEFATAISIATDEEGEKLIVARRPGEDFLRYTLDDPPREDTPLTAVGYDGAGIVVTPDGRIAYWSDRGLRHAATARVRYRSRGTVVGYALDAEHYQTRWGRVFIEACIPNDTSVRFLCLSADELDYVDAVPRTKPDRDDALTPIAREDLTPLPSAARLDQLQAHWKTLYRRGEDGPMPWHKAAQGYVYYEAPLDVDPGRFLWVVLELNGKSTRTPRIRSLRCETQGHDWLRRLPQLYSRQADQARFLQDYLAPLAGTMQDIALMADTRHILFNPAVAPAGSLNWLASCVGLTLEPCWPEDARRRMIAEAAALFAIRGTVASLKRMLEILTDAQIVIVEKFRLRGGGVIGEGEGTMSSAILGAGFRVGGAIGKPGETALAGKVDDVDDSFASHAHRFSVMIAADLSDEQLACVKRLVKVHRPAHTAFDICAISAGMRVGLGLHIGMTSLVGHSSGFGHLELGGSVLGRGYLLGRAKPAGPDAKREGAC
jgi:phage tail-like protein